MRYALMIEAQQGLSYAELLAIAQRAEAAGFEAMFRSDHYESFPGPPGRPTTDAWTVLAGLARETTRIRLGALVSPVTFRYPGSLAKIVATVDEMSGGRIELGIGAGWNDDEHRRHGFPFPPIEDRADMLEEQLAIVHGLWEEPDGWSFAGKHYRVEDAIFYPKPVQRPRVPILVGGTGTPRSLRLAARYADEFNLSSADAPKVADKLTQLDAACRAIGRDPNTIRRSAMVGTMIAADPGQLADRKKALLAELTPGEAAEDWFITREKRWIFGTPDQARAKIAEFAAAGVERLMFQDFLPRDLAMIDELGAELIGR
ncbi:MAG: LLM class F420-dependent oxidoreductase [Chloroflexota bacterium]